MFFLFGLRTGVHRLGARVLTCRNCANTAAQVVMRRTTKFTLFFIPLIPLRTRYVMQCTACGVVSDINRSDATHLAAH